MTNEQLRQRVQQIKRKPSRYVVDGMEQTLSNLPKRTVKSLQDKVLMASSIAAVLAVFVVYAGPPIARAAGALIERLFADRAQRYEQQLALPEDEKLAQSIASTQKAYQENLVNAQGQFFGTRARIERVWTSADDIYEPESKRGTLRFALIYDQIPPIDPDYVDFVLVMDGREIQMIVNEELADYRARGIQALTEEQWNEGDYGGERAGTNSEMNYSEALGKRVPTTMLSFPLDPWFIQRKTDMQIRATVDGRTDTLAFSFDPDQAHELAVQSAKEGAEIAVNQEKRKLEQYRTLEAAAVPVGISGSALGLDVNISELSVIDDLLSFSYSVSGIKEKNPHKVDFWIDNLYIDGYLTWNGSGDNDLKDGVLSGVRSFALGRDPMKLPEESLLVPSMIMQLDPSMEMRLAFRYNWQTKSVALPKDEAEMNAWIAESRSLTAELYHDMSEDYGTAFPVLGGETRVDGASLRITGAELNPATINFTGEVELDGVTLNEDQWRDMWNSSRLDLRVWVDGLETDAEHQLILNPTYVKPNQFDIYCPPPVNSAELYSDMPIKIQLHLLQPENGIDKTIETEFFVQRLRSSYDGHGHGCRPARA